MQTTPDRLRPALALTLVLAAAMLLGGCRRATWERVSITGGAPTAERPVSVDVSNWNGTVYVIADPGVKKGWVKARIKRTARKSPGKDALAREVWVGAETVEEAGGPVLRVLSKTTLAEPTLGKADLIIRVPSLAGASVRNAGGFVAIRGVNGPVTVENGVGGGKGGRVEVRTGAKMTYPVTLTTTNGLVHYQVTPESTAKFDLESADGASEIVANGGSLTGVAPSLHRWTGILNQGTNPVVLRTGDGTARVLITKDAGSYRPSRWTLRETWPFNEVY